MVKAVQKKIKHYKDLKDLHSSIRNAERSLYEGLHAGREGTLVLEAQKLHADVYLARNFIAEHDVSADRRMHLKADPHQSHSTYFVVRNRADGRIIATSRQIEVHPEKLKSSFPLLKKTKIEEKWLDVIMSHKLHSIVEISGLAKKQNTSSIIPLYLYRQMWHYSISQGHELWIMACDVRLFQRLKIMLGDAIIQIGEETKYQGGNVIPAIVKPRQALDALINSQVGANFMQRTLRSMVVAFFIDGIPETEFTPHDKERLRTLGITVGEMGR
jgi:N-acyl-L-homoserine lactone synthetase